MYRTIVAGTDGSAPSRAAVAAAAELARVTGAHLHLVIAFRRGDKAAPSQSSVRLVVEEDAARSDAVALLGRVADEIKGTGVPVTTHWRTGGPVDALLDVAGAEGADVIVTGSQGMHGARRVLGSVPDRIAHRASCSVLIVATS